LAEQRISCSGEWDGGCCENRLYCCDVREVDDDDDDDIYFSANVSN
jgi:hypothetical protein